MVAKYFAHVSATLKDRRFMTLMILVFVLAFSAIGGMAQSATLTIDTDSFINGINQWLPMALSITAIGVGIAGAFALATFVGRMILNAFDGKL